MLRVLQVRAWRCWKIKVASGDVGLTASDGFVAVWTHSGMSAVYESRMWCFGIDSPKNTTCESRVSILWLRTDYPCAYSTIDIYWLIVDDVPLFMAQSHMAVAFVTVSSCYSVKSHTVAPGQIFALVLCSLAGNNWQHVFFFFLGCISMQFNSGLT